MKQRRSRPIRHARITVSVGRDRLEKVRSAVAAGDAASISAYVDAAIAEKQRAETLEGVLDELDAAHGPATDEERAWVQRVLGD